MLVPTAVYLHPKIAIAVSELQARKRALLSMFSHPDTHRTDAAETCRNVPAGEARGTEGIISAISEIDGTIMKLISRSILDRKDLA